MRWWWWQNEHASAAHSCHLGIILPSRREDGGQVFICSHLCRVAVKADNVVLLGIEQRRWKEAEVKVSLCVVVKTGGTRER